MELNYYTPSGTADLISKKGMLTLLGTGIAAGGVWGIAKFVGTESKSAAKGALDSMGDQF